MTSENPVVSAERLIAQDTSEYDADTRRQCERWMLCWAINEVLGRILGENLSAVEPHLNDSDDETSDLVADLNFGKNLQSGLRIPLNGKTIIENPVLKQMLFQYRDQVRIALNRCVQSPDDVIGDWL